jgi:hypothetical protein
MTGSEETPYHDSVDGLRRELVATSERFRQDAAAFMPPSLAAAEPMHNAAYIGSLMAGTYSYTLAAVLGYARREFGEDVAHELACVADNLLMNGDDADVPYNADVMPVLTELDVALPGVRKDDGDGHH